MSKNPAVEQAKEGTDPFAIRTSLDGVRYQLHPVTPALMDAVTSRIKMPPVPMWYDKEMDREVPNPNHPDYIAAVEEVNRKRGTAAYDAMVMFGILLPDGLPKDDSWVKKLEYLAKHGILDLSEYDLNDPMDREFLYKRFILSDSSIVNEVGNLSALTAADIKAAGDSFPRNP